MKKNINKLFPTLTILCLFCFFSALEAFPIPLTKDWKISSGKNLQSGEDDPNWIVLQSLPIPKHTLDSFSYPEDTIHSVTLLKSFIISKEEISELSTDGLSVHFPLFTNVYEVFFNGERIGQGGSVVGGKIVRNGFKRHVILPIPKTKVKEGSNEIRVVLSSDPGEELNAYASLNSTPPLIDLRSRNSEILSERSTLMLAFLYLFVGFYHFLFYFKRNQDRYNLFFGLFSIFLSAYIYFRSNAVYELELDPLLQMKLEYMIVFNVPAFFLLFLEDFFRSKIGPLSRFYRFFALGLTSLIPFSSRFICIQLLQIWQFSVLVFSVYSFYIMFQALWRKNQDSVRLFAGFFILLASAILDLLGSMQMITGLENYGLLKYGFFTFELGIVFILANRFLSVHNEAEELNRDLDLKVRERTGQLQDTLDQIRELKIQQDGDYFLTSLLLDPLNRYQIKSDLYNIEGFSRQKKQFEFKQWKKEIGGDIIVADEILLKDRKYLAFVNGDAMGKSIQGAGGALVLGVVFRSFLARTQSVSSYKSKPPELWLKECFFELQNIFESFDGSMLVSVVLGLLDVKSGILFFLNAEHPWTALYRDATASFIEDKLELRKIGITGLESKMKIKTFFMENGDSIFIGSDGRDDLLLGVDSDGTRVINEDESQFLKRIEEARGDIGMLVQGLRNFGELTDDLSILKLTYLGRPKRFVPVVRIGATEFPDAAYLGYLRDERWELAADHLENIKGTIKGEAPPTFNKELAKVYYKIGKYQESLTLLEEFISEFPEDIESMFTASLLYKRLNRYRQAVELGERILLREPEFAGNVAHLAESYLFIHKKDAVLHLLSKLEKLDPANLHAREIRIQMENPIADHRND
ncbi:histidine kinase [Leptospira gomenensis]|uniref:Histidine kinase n=1 Tax=Leptospira gomenensis TaxID=2484974 RepID=A0A5F1YAQ4_9LEPT|nr:SpoIIE family protein phosphatase [Leptospira gomenensis]TGK33389.1 histidine kinase [Leptospira gomenensis]TGK44050.1 histidine kinase [Leptospira gomenensis]TGK46419.1 histidine kinase [Leptospira gomenensis]TGK67445.1 histidine kinase [Leptospira gomenensis]